MRIANRWQDYQVLDTGDGEKLERWGKYILRRPYPQVIWPKTLPIKEWEKAEDVYKRQVLACIAGLMLSFIGLIGANSDVSLKDLVTLNFVFDIPRIKEILTNIFSTMIVFSATLFFFAIGFAKKQREDVSQIKK